MTWDLASFLLVSFCFVFVVLRIKLMDSHVQGKAVPLSYTPRSWHHCFNNSPHAAHGEDPPKTVLSIKQSRLPLGKRVFSQILGDFQRPITYPASFPGLKEGMQH